MMKRISHVFEFIATTLLAFLVNLFPFSQLEKLAAFLVFLLSPLIGAAYKRIYNNIAVVYPEMTEQERKQFAKENLRNTARVMLEVMQARKFKNKKFIMKHVKPAHPDIESYYSGRDKGCLCVQGHFGNWEIPVAYYSHLGINISYSMQRLTNPMVNWQINRRRTNYGAHGIYSNDTGQLIRCLNKKNKNLLGLVADQDAGQNGIFIDFLGRKASAHTGPAILSYMAEVELTVLVCVYQGKGIYQIEIEKVDDVVRKNYSSREEAVEKLTQGWSSALEQKIRKNPTQYFWVHRRWKTRPAEETKNLQS